MGIFSNFFKKNKLNSEILSLVNLQDSIIMPPNTFFDNPKNKELYNQYYQEYKSILSSKKTILSTHLKDTETEDIRVYIDILTSLEIHIHDILDNPNKEEYNSDYVNNILARLNTYSLILNSIEKESFLRLAALSNLKSNPFLSRNKKNAIDNEISRLQIQIFNVQKINSLIKLQLNSCLNIIQNLKLETNEDFIKDLNNRLSKYLQAYGIITNEENIIYKQIKLEKHLFKIKNILIDLNKEFENLLNTSQLNRENRINQINILIDKYMAIKEYKRIENQELFYNLIEYKVNSYEIDYNIHQEIIGDLASYLEEKEIVKEIFLKKVNIFFQNPNVYQKYKEFNKSINPFTFSKIANTIKTSLKNELDIFNYNYIINNPILIGLIYSINNPIKLCKFFSEFIVLEEDYSTITCICKPSITWHNKFFLESLIRLREFIVLQNTLIEKIPRISYRAPLLYDKLLRDLNQLYKELIDKNFITKKEQNELYEGIKTINFNCDKKIYNLMIINYIFEMLNNQEIFLPSSLESFTLSYNDHSNVNIKSIPNIILNDGLTSFTLLKESESPWQLDKLDIPSSVKELKINVNTQNLNFINYPNSSLLNDQKALKEFINNIGKTQKLKFKGKTSVTTFSLNLEKLKNENKADADTIYNLFQEKIKEIYAKLCKIAIYLEISIEEKEINLISLRKLEDKIFNQIYEYSQKPSEKNPFTYAINYAKNLDERKINSERRTEMLNFFEICIQIFTIDLENLYSREISDCLEQFRRAKFNILLKALSKTQKPLINEDTPKEEIDFFRNLLLTKYRFKNNKQSLHKTNFEIELIYDIIVRKYAGKGNYYEFLLKNPFWLELMISDDKYQVFKRYKENINKGIINTEGKKWPQEVPYSTFIEEAIRHENEYDSSKTYTYFENFIHDLIPIYKLVKPNLENQVQNKKFKEANLTNNSDITLTRKHNL